MDICVPPVHEAAEAAMLWAEINVNRIYGPGNQNDDANSPAKIQKFWRLRFGSFP